MLYLTPPGLVQAEPDNYREHRLRLHLHPRADGPGQVGAGVQDDQQLKITSL